jgi:hypothetical protein
LESVITLATDGCSSVRFQPGCGDLIIKMVSSACWDVRFQLFKTVTNDTFAI